jgi:hypothetical protein
LVQLFFLCQHLFQIELLHDAQDSRPHNFLPGVNRAMYSASVQQSNRSDIAERIHRAAEEILKRAGITGSDLSAALIEAVKTFVVWPYAVGPISIQELDGSTDAMFDVAVYTGIASTSHNVTSSVPARSVACVFHLAPRLTLKELRAGYRRIGTVKRIPRPSIVGTGHPLNDVPLGVILSVDSENSLETIAEQMMVLNKEIPSTEWPDMIAVLAKGTVNYAVQFEGDKIRGDFLLPNTTDNFPVMPMYVHVFARGLALHSLNRLFSFLFMHLQTFSPGTKLPHEAAVQGISEMGMTLGGYQFNLMRRLVPVPDEMRIDRGAGLRNLPFRIESRDGELLAHVHFIPWQEGGAIRIIGKMPLESLLIFLGPVMKEAQIIHQKEARISSVLPISRNDFLVALRKFQAQSNMVVKPEQPTWTVSKMGDEGTSTPFIARLFMGVLNIRERVFFEKEDRDLFDKPYEATLISMSDARVTAKEIHRLVREHKSKVSTGEIARLVGKAVHVDGIDKELRKHTADFATSAGRALKQGMQSVVKALGLDIGFFFKQRNQFETGLSKLSLTRPELADYLREARSWAEELNLLRNGIEHEGWILPRVRYRVNGGKIEVVEPEIGGKPLSEFVEHTLDRLCCFVEEVTVYGLQTKMDSAVSIQEVPRGERDPNAPERFRPALALGGTRLWKLVYHTSSFETK